MIQQQNILFFCRITSAGNYFLNIQIHKTVFKTIGINLLDFDKILAEIQDGSEDGISSVFIHIKTHEQSLFLGISQKCLHTGLMILLYNPPVTSFLVEIQRSNPPLLAAVCSNI